MRRFQFNKLVRDKVPALFETKNIVSHFHMMDEAEQKEALKVKCVEEAREMAEATTQEKMLSEMVDILEVLDALAAVYGISKEEMNQKREEKRLTKGSYGKVFMDFVDIPEESPEITHYLENPERYPEIG